MRAPDRIIGVNYLHRWHVIPRNKFFNIYLHKFIGDDDDRATHDHPFHSMSILLRGSLHEICETRGRFTIRSIKRFMPVFRRAKHAHRLILGSDEPALTLFITGPVIRRWGFHCPKGWVYWKDFTDPTGNGIGRGCD